MFSRFLALIFLTGLGSALAGCRHLAPPESEIKQQVTTNAFPLGKLTFDLPSFSTLEELQRWGAPRNESKKFFYFEKDEAKVVVVVPVWGSGDWFNAILIYAYDPLRSLWRPVAVWNPEVRGVTATFDNRRGIIHFYSGKGAPLLSANIDALRTRRTREW